MGADGLNVLLADTSIDQILVSAWDRVTVSRSGQSTFLDAGFTSQETLEAAAASLLGELGIEEDKVPPVVDSVLPSGVSVNLVARPLAPMGPVITLRRPRETTLTAHALVKQGVISKKAVDYLSEAVRARKNVLVAGRPGSGRTTVLNALAYFIPGDERIALVEDAREITVPHRDVVYLDKNALEDYGEHFVDLVPQLLAQRVVVDSVATSDIFAYASLALGGYDGLLATTTSDSCHGLLRRLALELELTIGARLDDRARAMVAESVDVVVLVRRTDEGSRVTEILEVRREADDGYDTLAVQVDG